MQSTAEWKIFPGYVSFSDLRILGRVDNIFKYLISHQVTSLTFKWPLHDVCVDRLERAVSWEVRAPAQEAHTRRNDENSAHQMPEHQMLVIGFWIATKERGYERNSFFLRRTFLSPQKYTFNFDLTCLLWCIHWATYIICMPVFLKIAFQEITLFKCSLN